MSTNQKGASRTSEPDTTDLDVTVQLAVENRRLKTRLATVQTKNKALEVELKQRDLEADTETLRDSLELLDRVVAPTYKLPKLPAAKPTKGNDTRVAIVYPDAQIWYWQDRKNVWKCTHDESAMDCAIQVTARVQEVLGIDVQVDLADLCDFAAATKHRTPVAMLGANCTQASFTRSGLWLAQRAALAPSADRYITWGNHEDRLMRLLEEQMPWMIGVHAAGQSEPALSASNLLGAKRNGNWKGVGPYPSAQLDLSRNLRCKHGDQAKAQPGATGAEYLKEETNTIFGHSPHAQLVYRTVKRKGSGKPESRTFLAYGPGCLCKVTGCVPSQRTGSDDYGQPDQQAFQPWEQGIGIVHYDRLGRGVPYVEHVPIFGGQAVWRGETFTARCDPDGYPLEG